MSEHTKTPWVIGRSADHETLCIDAETPKGTREICEIWNEDKYQNGCSVDELAKADAAFIVLACNSHGDLLEALEAIAKMSYSTEAWFHDDLCGNETDAWEDGQSRGHFDAAVIARAALKKAKP